MILVILKIIFALVAIITMILCWKFATSAEVTHVNDEEVTKYVPDERIKQMIYRMKSIFFWVAIVFAFLIGLMF